MPLVDVVDDTFVVAPVEALAAVVADPDRWAAWWPDLRLVTTRDRGVKGRQWRVGGALTGTAEIWLEPWADGVLVHLFLRLDPAPLPAGAPPARPARQTLPQHSVPGTARWAERTRARRAQDWKRTVHALKDELEAGRSPGAPAALKPVASPVETSADGDARGHRP